MNWAPYSTKRWETPAPWNEEFRKHRHLVKKVNRPGLLLARFKTVFIEFIEALGFDLQVSAAPVLFCCRVGIWLASSFFLPA